MSLAISFKKIQLIVQFDIHAFIQFDHKGTDLTKLKNSLSISWLYYFINYSLYVLQKKNLKSVYNL